MLLFNRSSFRSGTMIIRVEVGETNYAFGLKPSDKGKVYNFGSEAIAAAVLAKYPAFFSVPE